MVETFRDWIRTRYGISLLLGLAVLLLTQFLIIEPWFGVSFVVIGALTSADDILMLAGAWYLRKDLKSRRITVLGTGTH
jgi:hypothetical protein